MSEHQLFFFYFQIQRKFLSLIEQEEFPAFYFSRADRVPVRKKAMFHSRLFM